MTRASTTAPHAGDALARNNEIATAVPDLSRAGTVTDGALGAAGDAGRLAFVDLSISDRDPVMAAARHQAVAAARVQAEQMAAGAGVHLGRLVSLSDQSPDNSGPPRVAASGGIRAAGQAAMASVPIQPGVKDLTVTVTAVWEIAPS